MPQSVVIDATSAAAGSNPKSNIAHAIETATASQAIAFNTRISSP